MNTLLRPLPLSLLTHVLIVMVVLVLVYARGSKEVTIVPIEISVPEEVQELKEIKKETPIAVKSINEPAPTTKPVREVFGANRNSYTDSSVSEAAAVEAKRGNTLAKASDSTVLTEDDVDALPTPTEEYLVSEMPSVKTEIRPVYPEAARLERKEGSVVLDILIDDQGRVRQAQVVEGEEVFRAEALVAIKRFEFSPARVDGKPVAVRIRYRLNFKLEY